MSDQFKREAAERAALDVVSGMRLGIGTGSTAEFFVHALAKKIEQEGIDVIGVPTSERTAELASSLGIKLTTLEQTPQLDLTVDGADELDANLALIKGGGGALLREKIVAAASKQMIVIADSSKVVPVLGKFALPIEVVPFGQEATRRAILEVFAKLGLPQELALRGGEEHPFVTDGGHVIYDAQLKQIENPAALADALVTIPGVVETGLFLNLSSKAYVAGEDGVKTITPASN